MKIYRSLVLSLLLCLGTISAITLSLPGTSQSCEIPKDTPKKPPK